MKNLIEMLTEAKSKFKVEKNSLVYDGKSKCFAVLYTSENENAFNTQEGGDFNRVSAKLVDVKDFQMESGINNEEEFKAVKKLNVGEMKADFEEKGIIVVRLR